MKNTLYRLHCTRHDSSFFVQEYIRIRGAEFCIGPIVFFGSLQECVILLGKKRKAGYTIYGD
jgi:hypothetical protein